MNFEGGKRNFSICTKCNISPFSLQHILLCLGFSCEETIAPPTPAVLRLCTGLWAYGSGLVSLDEMGISSTTRKQFACVKKKQRSSVSEALQRVRQSFVRNPRKSSKIASCELGMLQKTVYKILRKKLNFKKYHLQFTQQITEDDK
ncbi:uncharacterized protein TNCV_2276491 [Trichonephila clavipes]|nr:uncharacterized protein TNCV_2276491 [Trichonephila clavipes]